MTMTPRERWLAAIDLQPTDRLPFWPKLSGSYARAQAAPFRDVSIDAIHEWVGSDRHTGVAGCIKDERPRTGFENRQDDGFLRQTYVTPCGNLQCVQKWDEASQSWHPIEFPVKTREDIKVMTGWYEDCTVALDTEQLAKAQEQCREIGETAITTNGIGESPLMHWVEWLAGVENAHYLLADALEETEALFAAIHANLIARAEIICEHSPADLIYMVENTSTTLISPGQYMKYCFPHISAYGEIGRALDRRIVLHMCGYLKDLLPDLAKLPVAAFEAFTSPPVGNTTFVDGRAACPDTCLVGGTNATLWTYPAERIIAELDEHLSALPHHRGLVVTSAGVMPPLASPETIRTVCNWVKAYDARM